MKLILASTSKYRRELLARLGFSLEAVAPVCDEGSYLDKGLSPRRLATILATAKASSLAERFPHDVILGSDQVATIDGQILGKPETMERAREQLRLLSGRTHQLITAVTIVARGEFMGHCDTTSLTMRELRDAEIDRYLELDQPLDCAGSFKLESRGISLFSAIDSRDHTAIVGLPLIAVNSMLRTLGLEH